MRLAYLTSRFPYAHIGETFLEPEVRVLARLCGEVHVIPARPQSRRSLFGALGTIDVRIAPWEPATVAGAINEAAAHPLRAARALGIIAFAGYPFSAKFRNLTLFPKALAVARYARTHKIEHIHANWLTTSSTIAYIASMMTDIPWSCTAHAHDIFSRNLVARKARSARFVRVISERNRTSLNELIGHRYDNRTYVGHLGVEVPQTPAPVDFDGRTFTMVCPARLDPMKGHMDLLDALVRLRDAGCRFHCDIAGDGELRDQISNRIAQLGLDHYVTMRGIVQHAVLLAELRSATYDLVVLSSESEGIPVALMEAMAAGVPCVATRIGSIPELIDGQTGILVDHRDPGSFADAIERLARDPLHRRRLGSAARERILAEFDVTKTARALYERISAEVTRAGAAGHACTPSVSSPANIPIANAN